jgi:two-component system, response regulator RegA
MTPRALLVDDDDGNRATLSALLESEAFDVTQASSLAEARKSLTAAAFDLVLLDQHLSDGVGLELIPALRAQLPNCKIIVVSGDGNDENRPAIASADGYFDKGDDPDVLFEKIHALLRV